MIPTLAASGPALPRSSCKVPPKYRTDNDWNWEDQTRTRGVNDYYGIPPGVVAG